MKALACKISLVNCHILNIRLKVKQMEYKYAPNKNYEDFASGRVLYHMGGEPTFPVRLALEIYGRCLGYSEKKRDIFLYDCCCGGAYMLTVLGLLAGDSIAKIYASDIDEKSLNLAVDNLALLTKDGIIKRRAELEDLYRSFGKESHREALESIDRIEGMISGKIITKVFRRNALEKGKLSFTPDIVITDVPYGNLTAWNGGSNEDQSSFSINGESFHGDGSESNQKMGIEGVNLLMDALYEICSQDTIICICSDKKQKMQTDHYKRLEKQLVGKRKFEIYKKM